MESRICGDCGNTYPNTDEYFNLGQRNTKWDRCKGCQAKALRVAILWREYGLTTESWQVQFNRQGGRCAICGIHQSDLNTILHIDHNHVTGELRGLLCVKCNTGLGCFNTDTESVKLLELAVKYTKEAKWIV